MREKTLKINPNLTKEFLTKRKLNVWIEVKSVLGEVAMSLKMGLQPGNIL